MKFSAYVGATIRTRIDGLAQQWGMTLAQAVRRIVILGLGGDEADVAMANEESAGRCQQMSDALGVELTPGGPRARAARPAGPQKATIDCAFPRRWASKLRKAGGLKACIGRGLVAIGEAD